MNFHTLLIRGKEMKFILTYGWYALLIAVIGDLLFSTIFSLFYKEYTSLTMSISALGNPQSPVRMQFNIWMFIEGVLFLIALPALYKQYHSTSGWMTNILISCIAVFAIGACIFTAFFSVNETKNEVTAASKIHGVGSVLGFMFFLFVPLLVAILSLKGGEKIIGGISIICFIFSLVFFALFVMSDKEEFANTVVSNEGLWQRLNLIFMYLPLAMVSVKSILQIH